MHGFCQFILTTVLRSYSLFIIYSNSVIYESRHNCLFVYVHVFTDDHCSMDGAYSDLSEIKETFLASLALGPCIIILDGLDEIAACSNLTMTEVRSELL